MNIRPACCSALVLAGLLAIAAGAHADTTLTVTNTNDAGPGSFRQALLEANAAPDIAVIGFAIPGAGLHTIQALSAMPEIANQVAIDGYTQPGASANTLNQADNAVLAIELDGSLAGPDVNGVVFGPGANRGTLRGLVINRFDGVGVLVAGVNEVLILGNFIGTDATGAAALGNGVGVDIAEGTANVIGDDAPLIGDFPCDDHYAVANRNLISGNLGSGVRIGAGTPAQPAIITGVCGNLIGSDASGTGALGNGGHGIELGAGVEGTGVAGNVVQDNVIVANGGNGIDMLGNGTGFRNQVGVGVGGVALGNAGHGMHVGGASQDAALGGGYILALGRDQPGIANNGGAGVYIDGDARFDIAGMTIGDNVGLGIDLAPPGVTPNDAGDADGGPNDGLNSPEITSAIWDPSVGGTIAGAIHSEPGSDLDILFYLNDACDPSGYGEGAQELVNFNGNLSLHLVVHVTTDAAGDASFSAHASDLPPGKYLTAFTRHGAEVSSEYSACRLIENAATGSPGTLQFGASSYSVDEADATATITVTRSGGSSGTVGVAFATTDDTATAPGDYASVAGSVAFADGDSAAKTFTVPIVDDNDIEGGETIGLSLSAPSGGAGLGNPATAVLGIVDNDAAPPPPPPTDAIPTPTLSWFMLLLLGGLLALSGIWAPRVKRRSHN